MNINNKIRNKTIFRQSSKLKIQRFHPNQQSRMSILNSTAKDLFLKTKHKFFMMELGNKKSKQIHFRIQKTNRHFSSFKNITNNIQNLQLTTKSWCLYDSIRKKYVGFREDYKRQIASLTKIMTTIVAIKFIEEYNLPLDIKVKITSNSAYLNGTSAQLPFKSWVSLQCLIFGTMLPSGNDAAMSLAQYMGYLILNKDKSMFIKNISDLDLTKVNTIGYVKQFIKSMNQLAFQLKLINTNFSNPHGLQNALNTSSAKDILKLSRYCCKNKYFKKVMNTKIYQAEMVFQNHKTVHKKWQNTNKLLQKQWQGVKTGLTPTAGSCLSSLKSNIYIVVLNCGDSQARFSDTQKIYQWYSQNYNHKLKTNIQSVFDQTEVQINKQKIKYQKYSDDLCKTVDSI